MEPFTIVAMRVADAKIVVPGSEVNKCDKCGMDVWLAPSSKGVPRDGIICVPCALAMAVEARKDGEPVAVFTSEEAIGEVRAWQAKQRAN